MGGSVSTRVPVVKDIMPGASVEDIARVVMPLYYTQEPITPEEYEAANTAWKLITRNQCQAFFDAKAADPSISCKIATEYMHQVFYARLFDVHPACRALFSRSVNKMNLVPMFTMCLTKLESDSGALKKSLAHLVRVHNLLGVKAAEYGLAGEMLFFAMQKVLGGDYTPLAHRGWTKIYSAMLEIIIPEVIRFEISQKEEALQVLKKRTGNTLDRSVAGGSLASLVTIAMPSGAPVIGGPVGRGELMKADMSSSSMPSLGTVTP